MENDSKKWLLVWGAGGCWSGYPSAATFCGSEEEARWEVFEKGFDSWNVGAGGLSTDIEEIETTVKNTRHWKSSRLKTSAKAMVS